MSSKSLFEQVAEMEAGLQRLGRKVFKLEAERSMLSDRLDYSRDHAEKLTQERDEFQQLANDYAGDDHQNAALRSPRLTVHDLRNAPIKSVMRFGPLEAVKAGGGWWVTPSGQAFSDAEIIERGWATATLTTPEGD